MMRKNVEKTIVGVFILFLMGRCKETPKETRQVITQDDVAIEVARGVEILYSDSAVVRVRVIGPILHNFNERENARQEFPEGIRIDFLEADCSVRSTLTAKKAIRQQEKGLITVRDSVVWSTAKQEKLETEELVWDEKSGKVRTEKFVKVTQPGEIIYGYGLEADQNFSYWKILVPKGRLKVDQLNDNAL